MLRILADRALAALWWVLTVERRWHVRGLIASNAHRDRIEFWRRLLRR